MSAGYWVLGSGVPADPASGSTPGQVALAWLLAQQPWIVPIPGTRQIGRVEESAGATALALSADEVADLDALTQTIR